MGFHIQINLRSSPYTPFFFLILIFIFIPNWLIVQHSSCKDTVTTITAIIVSSKTFILSTLWYLMIPLKSSWDCLSITPTRWFHWIICLTVLLHSALLKLTLVLFCQNNSLILSDPLLDVPSSSSLLFSTPLMCILIQLMIIHLSSYATPCFFRSSRFQVT